MKTSKFGLKNLIRYFYSNSPVIQKYWTAKFMFKLIKIWWCTYVSVGVDNLLDVFELVAEFLPLSQGEAVVVEAAHLLPESAAGVVERGHASDVGGTTLEGAVPLAGEQAGWHVGSQFVVIGWLGLIVALSSHQLAAHGVIARPVGGGLFVCPVRHWGLAEASDAAHLEQAESWYLGCNLNWVGSVRTRSVPLLSVRVASFDILDRYILAGITFAARVNVNFIAE